MREALELLRIATGLMGGPNIRDIQKTLGDLDELSDNIEDAIETFSLHFVVASVDTDIDSQFELLRKATEGLKSSVAAKKSLEQVQHQFPEDKTVQRALRDADTMIARFQRHRVAAKKVIRAISKKDMPSGLKKYTQSVARIVRGKFKDPKSLVITPWQNKHYKGGVVYQVTLSVSGSKKSLNKNKDASITLAEYTNSREPAGLSYNSGNRIKSASPKEAAAILLDNLRGWDGLKGAEEEGIRRDKILHGVMSSINRALHSMSAIMIDEAEITGRVSVEGSYRSSKLPKDGARAVGEYAYEKMEQDEIDYFEKVLSSLLGPYMKDIKSVSYDAGEKSWVSVYVEVR